VTLLARSGIGRASPVSRLRAIVTQLQGTAGLRVVGGAE